MEKIKIFRKLKKKSISEDYILYDITYIWNLIYDTNEPFHRKENHGHGEQTLVAKGKGRGREWDGLGIWA